jgi:hypothetical protein
MSSSLLSNSVLFPNVISSAFYNFYDLIVKMWAHVIIFANHKLLYVLPHLDSSLIYQPHHALNPRGHECTKHCSVNETRWW